MKKFIHPASDPKIEIHRDYLHSVILDLKYNYQLMAKSLRQARENPNSQLYLGRLGNSVDCVMKLEEFVKEDLDIIRKGGYFKFLQKELVPFEDELGKLHDLLERAKTLHWDMYNRLGHGKDNEDYEKGIGFKKIAFAEPNRADHAVYVTARSIFRVLEEIYKKLGLMIRDKERDRKFEGFAKDKIVEASLWYSKHYKHAEQCEYVEHIKTYVEVIKAYLDQLDNEGIDKRDHTIVLSPSQYNVTPGKFRPSVFRRFEVGLGVGAMLGGYAGYKLGRGKKKLKKFADTIVLTDIMNKSGFFCPYCSATLVMKNPMDDAVRCKCGRNFTVIMKHVFHPKDKHMGKSFDPFDEFEKLGLPILPIENLKLVNRMRGRIKRLWNWRHKKAEEPVAKGFPIAPIAAIADDVALLGYYGLKNRKNKKKQKQMRLAQSQINRR